MTRNTSGHKTSLRQYSDSFVKKERGQYACSWRGPHEVVVQLLPSGAQPDTNNGSDISLDRIQYVKLPEKTHFKGYGSDIHRLQFMNPRAGNRICTLMSDKHLKYAVEALRDYGVKSIRLEWALKKPVGKRTVFPQLVKTT
jgi:hypothetical protein